MIQYKRFTLSNGLRVLVHEDHSTPMAAINMCYYVGARDESPDKTGFAHLFEHLMFAGTDQAPDFDVPIQLAGGENNAFTNNDITNFYNIVPSDNLETALWLESDRMTNLHIKEQSLEVQRKVVVEEFKETCLNEPYGDVWHHLSDLAYKVHPYRWPTIGRIPEHVMEASLDDVRYFYQKYYQPNNAVLTITGNIEFEKVEQLVKKWFEPIESGIVIERKWPVEPPQQIFQKRVLHTQIPTNALYFAFHIPSRVDPDFYGVDLLSDILGNGPSSRLYKRLLKDAALFSFIDCYISGTIDPGLLIIEAKPLDNVSIEQAQKAIWAELEQLKREKLTERELKKVQNKVVSTLLFSEVSILNKAINLAFFEILGNAELINQEAQLYRRVSLEDIQKLAQRVFKIENCSEVIYEKK